MAKQLKIAIFHSFFKVYGGAEKMMLDIRNHYQADLFTGAIKFDVFHPSKQDLGSQKLFNPEYNLTYLHKDSQIPIWYAIKRQLYFLFSPKINALTDYDVVIFSGNIFWVQRRLRKLINQKNTQTKLINYVNTPPRRFTDHKNLFLEKLPFFLRPLYNILSNFAIAQYKKDLEVMDTIITNSKNIQARLKKFLGFDSTPIFPPVDVDKFEYQSTGDYFLSHSRLEDAKRIKLIVETFKNLPNKKLIICSTGPLKNWVLNEIKENQLENIEYKGLVSDEELKHLIENCLAGIVIPKDEDAGMVQVELMGAGKPVIGVQEGGLLETVIDQKTGILIKSNPAQQDLTTAIQAMSKDQAVQMKNDCLKQANKFNSQRFFKELDKFIY